MIRKIFIAGVLLLCACTQGGPVVHLISPEGEKITVAVEIADEPGERELGLMNRTQLGEGTGMLFIFEQPREMAFWMKNTLIPLDILYFDAEGRLVSYTTMEPCVAKDPCRTYSSGGAAQYALEVNKGFIAEHGIGEGWELVLNEK